MDGVTPDVVYQLFVGVAMAAATATVAWQAPKQKPGKAITIEQTPDGFSLLHQRRMKTGAPPAQTLVVLEATGIRLPFFRPLLLATRLCWKPGEPGTGPSFCQSVAQTRENRRH